MWISISSSFACCILNSINFWSSSTSILTMQGPCGILCCQLAACMILFLILLINSWISLLFCCFLWILSNISKSAKVHRRDEVEEDEVAVSAPTAAVAAATTSTNVKRNKKKHKTYHVSASSSSSASEIAVSVSTPTKSDRTFLDASQKMRCCNSPRHQLLQHLQAKQPSWQFLLLLHLLSGVMEGLTRQESLQRLLWSRINWYHNPRHPRTQKTEDEGNTTKQERSENKDKPQGDKMGRDRAAAELTHAGSIPLSAQLTHSGEFLDQSCLSSSPFCSDFLPSFFFSSSPHKQGKFSCGKQNTIVHKKGRINVSSYCSFSSSGFSYFSLSSPLSFLQFLPVSPCTLPHPIFPPSLLFLSFSSPSFSCGLSFVFVLTLLSHCFISQFSHSAFFAHFFIPHPSFIFSPVLVHWSSSSEISVFCHKLQNEGQRQRNRAESGFLSLFPPSLHVCFSSSQNAGKFFCSPIWSQWMKASHTKSRRAQSKTGLKKSLSESQQCNAVKSKHAKRRWRPWKLERQHNNRETSNEVQGLRGERNEKVFGREPDLGPELLLPPLLEPKKRALKGVAESKTKKEREGKSRESSWNKRSMKDKKRRETICRTSIRHHRIRNRRGRDRRRKHITDSWIWWQEKERQTGERSSKKCLKHTESWQSWKGPSGRFLKGRGCRRRAWITKRWLNRRKNADDEALKAW